MPLFHGIPGSWNLSGVPHIERSCERTEPHPPYRSNWPTRDVLVNELELLDLCFYSATWRCFPRTHEKTICQFGMIAAASRRRARNEGPSRWLGASR